VPLIDKAPDHRAPVILRALWPLSAGFQILRIDAWVEKLNELPEIELSSDGQKGTELPRRTRLAHPAPRLTFFRPLLPHNCRD
jgi:hypothetical protein